MVIWKFVGVFAAALCCTAANAQAGRAMVLVLADVNTEGGREVACATSVSDSNALEVRLQGFGGYGDAASAVQRALDVERNLVAVIGPIGTSVASILSDIELNKLLRGTNVAYISLALTPVVLKDRSPEYLRVGPTTASLRQAAEAYLIEQWKPDAIGIVGLRSDQAFAGTSDAASYFASLGRKTAGQVFQGQGLSRELDSFASKPRVGLVYVNSDIQAAIEAAAKYRDAKVVVTYERPEQNLPPNLFVAAPPDPRKLPSAQEFVRRFTSKCPKESLSGYALASYVAMQTVDQAISKTGVSRRIDAQKVLELLRTGAFATAVGGNRRYGRGGELHYGTASTAIWGQGLSSSVQPVVQSTDNTKQKCQGSVCDQCSDCTLNGQCSSSRTCPP